MNDLRILLNFLAGLEERKVSYRLEHNRQGSIMVLIALPGERWEAEFFPDGNIELEVFGKSAGVHSVTMENLVERLEEKSK